jgi:hypothetical protein
VVLIEEMNRWEGGMLLIISRGSGWLLIGTNKTLNYPSEHAQTGHKGAVIFQRIGEYVSVVETWYFNQIFYPQFPLL